MKRTLGWAMLPAPGAGFASLLIATGAILFWTVAMFDVFSEDSSVMAE
ncbi:MAG: hypothetical protein RR100_26170 [Comamonas sp.]